MVYYLLRVYKSPTTYLLDCVQKNKLTGFYKKTYGAWSYTSYECDKVNRIRDPLSIEYNKYLKKYKDKFAVEQKFRKKIDVERFLFADSL